MFVHLYSGPTAATAKVKPSVSIASCVSLQNFYVYKAKYEIFSPLACLFKKESIQTWIYSFLFTYLGKLSYQYRENFFILPDRCIVSY